MRQATKKRDEQYYKIAKFPGGTEILYKPSVTEVPGGFSNAVVMEFAPSMDERIALMAGGIIRVVLTGAKTPLQTDVGVTADKAWLQSQPDEPDIVWAIAEAQYAAGDVPRTTTLRGAPEATRELYLTRAKIAARICGVLGGDDDG
jgi:hypothetical protein